MLEDVGLDLLGDAPPLSGIARLALSLGQFGPAVQRHPAHHFRRREVLRLPADLPDATVGLTPVRDRLLHLFLQHGPQGFRDLLAGFGVQVERVQNRAPDVVLHLVVGAIANPHRARVVVAGQMVEFLFDQAALTAHAVHHLKRMALIAVGAGHVGDERKEVVGLAIQAQGVEPPQRECRVANPGVAVVPVAFAARRLRQRRGAGRQQRAGGRIGQPLQCERAALQIFAPRVIGEVADVDPLSPALGRLPHLVGGLLIALRRRVMGPTQRHEHVVALVHPGACPRLTAFQTDVQIRGHPQRRVVVRLLAGTGDGLAVRVARVLPGGAFAVVVERRLAAHHQLDGAAHAAHGAQQDVLGIPVHRSAAMRPRPPLDVVPFPHHQGVAHDQPAGVGLPGGFHDQAAGQVSAGRGHRDAVGADPEMAGAAVQDRAEDAGGVRAGHAQPLHRTGGGDQAGRLPVGQKRVIGDRRKRIAQRCIGRERRGCAVVDGWDQGGLCCG